MKWILLVLAFCVCVLIGFLFSVKYKKRANLFKALVMLTEKLDVGINYSRERLQTIFKSLDESLKKDLLGLTNNYLKYLEGTSSLNKEQLFEGINQLKENEKEVVYMFFKMLGRSDVDNQSKEIKNFQVRFEDLAVTATQDNKKYGGLSLKMGVIIGLMAVVILW